MKLSYLTAAVALILFTIEQETDALQSQQLKSIQEHCAAVEGIKPLDLLTMANAKEQDISKDYKCFINCIVESTGLVKDGKFDKFTQRVHVRPIKDVLMYCNQITLEKGYNALDKCDFGYKFGSCYSKVLSTFTLTNINPLKLHCANKTGIELNQEKQWKNVTSPPLNFKCFHNCIFETLEVLKNGTIDRSIFTKEFHGIPFYDEVRECYLQIFEKKSSNIYEKCELAYQLELCLEKRADAEDEDEKKESVENNGNGDGDENV